MITNEHDTMCRTCGIWYNSECWSDGCPQCRAVRHVTERLGPPVLAAMSEDEAAAAAAAADVVDLHLAIPPDLYDAVAETAERMGFGLKEWCLAALEIGVEGNLLEEEMTIHMRRPMTEPQQYLDAVDGVERAVLSVCDDFFAGMRQERWQEDFGGEVLGHIIRLCMEWRAKVYSHMGYEVMRFNDYFAANPKTRFIDSDGTELSGRAILETQARYKEPTWLAISDGVVYTVDGMPTSHLEPYCSVSPQPDKEQGQ